jgi:hypothetical protein
MPSGGQASQIRASTTALALFFLKTHCGCEQHLVRTPSCASFDLTRESIMAEWAELRRELDDTRAALAMSAKRLPACVNFVCAQRQPDQPLH